MYVRGVFIMTKQKYIDYNELVSKLREIANDEYNNIREMEIMIVLLMRNGLSMRQITKLRNSDFDFDKKLVTIKNGNSISKLKLDDETMYWVKASRDEDGTIPGTRHQMRIVDDHIIKMSTDEYTEEQALSSIKRRMTKFRDNGFMPLSEKVLINSRMVDILDDIVEKQGYVTTDDFKRLQVQFGNDENSYFSLRRNYEKLRGKDRIQLQQRGRKSKNIS